MSIKRVTFLLLSLFPQNNLTASPVSMSSEHDLLSRWNLTDENIWKSLPAVPLSWNINFKWPSIAYVHTDKKGVRLKTGTVAQQGRLREFSDKEKGSKSQNLCKRTVKHGANEHWSKNYSYNGGALSPLCCVKNNLPRRAAKGIASVKKWHLINAPISFQGLL